MTARIFPVLAAAALVVTLGACAKEATMPATPAVAAPAPAMVEETTKATAIVTAVDQKKRQLTLKRADGTMLEVFADQGVRNFAQIKKGDQVIVSYREAIAAELAKPGQAAKMDSATGTVTRAAEGAMPAMSAEASTTTTVTIDKLDLPTHTVTFTRPDGEVVTLSVVRPQMQAFLETLKVGDKVDVTYTEAVAVEVTPAAK